MKIQTKQEMIDAGATEQEAIAALELFTLLRPCLKVNKENGRVDLIGGSKTPLGLFRTVKDLIFTSELGGYK